MDSTFVLPANWQDWLVVFGYMSFTAFIIWQILTRSQRER